MKRFRNMKAMVLAILLVTILAAGCGSKDENPDVQITSLQAKDDTGQGSDREETDTKLTGNKEETKNTGNTGDKNKESDKSTDESRKETGSESESTSEKNRTEGNKPQTSTEKPVNQQGTTQAPTQAQATQKPTQAPTQKPTQAPTTQAPTQAPTTQAPTQAPQKPVQPSSSVTIPITVSDRAVTAAGNIISSITNGSMSEFDKVKAIHDYIVKNVDYPATIDTNNSSLFTAEGALVNKLAVCQGYAEAFSLLCYKAGIQTEMVYGTANNGQGTESHAWNLVRVDGVWYQMDTTWDDPIGQNTANGANLRYNYFLVPDSVMNLNHTAQIYTKQYACTDTRYLEYGEQMTASLFVKEHYGDIKYSFAASEADVKKIATDNRNAGMHTYVIVYNMGQKLNGSLSQAVYAKVNEIMEWIIESGNAPSGISVDLRYQCDMKYVAVKVVTP